MRRAARSELDRRARARSHLIDFTLYTKSNYRGGQHHLAIAEKLEAVERGEIKRLLVMAPPRHGKTELVSRRFPAWFLGRHPDLDFISASYGQELALDFGRDVRNIVSMPEYRAIFPAVRLAADSQAKDRWHVSGGGGYVAAGVGTAITGRGAHIFNIDDPVKDRASAESELQRKATWDWYRSVAYTRLQPGAAVVLTLTRWHEQDLAGLILEQEAEDGGEKWEKLILPAIDVHGNALWEDAYPRPVLDQIRKTIGEYEWASLYEQRPRPIGGSFFSETSLLVDGAPVPDPVFIDTVFATIDTAIKTGKDHSGLGCVFWAVAKRGQTPYPLFVLDYDYLQLEGAFLENWLPTVFSRLEEYAKLCQARRGSLGAYIEDKASGMVLLQQGMNRRWPVHPIDSKLTAMGKSERAINISGHVHAGTVKLTRRAYDKVVSYLGVSRNHLLSQVLGFRAGTMDNSPNDLLDCFSYGVALALGNSEGF